MTPEREIYLNNICNEERAIRETIEFHNMKIADEKFYINYYAKIKSKSDKYIILAKEKIVKNKAIIKALKKQIPAPMKEEMFYNVKVVNCPIFDSALDTWVENYCWKCGQKLR